MTPPSDQERMENVWRQRASRLSRRPVAAGTSGDEVQAIVLRIADAHCGIALAEVAEVLPPVQVTPVPGAPPTFLGVVNVRGEIRPVIDLRHVLGLAPAKNGGLSRVLLLRRQGREMGLNVDNVEQIRRIPSDELKCSGDRYTDLSAHY